MNTIVQSIFSFLFSADSSPGNGDPTFRDSFPTSIYQPRKSLTDVSTMSS